MSLNVVILSGNIGREPETRNAGSSSVTSFAIAVNESWKDRDGNKQERTSWVDVEAWGKTGDMVSQYLGKGAQCTVEGRLQQDTWDDRETGQKRSKLKVVANRVHFGPRQQKQEDPRLARGGGGYSAPEDDDEIPFTVPYSLTAPELVG